MPTYSPRQLEEYVDEQARSVGTRAFVTKRQHQRLREMWCAARFGLGYSNHFAACSIEVAEEDEQQDFDFHLVVDKGRLPFQVTEVLDQGRLRDLEYKTRTEQDVFRLQDKRPRLSDTEAAILVQERLRSKQSTYGAGALTVHMLIYLNVNASSVSWASLAAPAEGEAQGFASTWVVTQDLFCCLHGGALWTGLVGWRAVESAA